MLKLGLPLRVEVRVEVPDCVGKIPTPLNSLGRPVPLTTVAKVIAKNRSIRIPSIYYTILTL